jgi:hypothetical protein
VTRLDDFSPIGRLFENFIQKWPKFVGHVFSSKSYVLILANDWLGYILGDFFTNSGHPVTNVNIFAQNVYYFDLKTAIYAQKIITCTIRWQEN